MRLKSLLNIINKGNNEYGIYVLKEGNVIHTNLTKEFLDKYKNYIVEDLFPYNFRIVIVIKHPRKNVSNESKNS